MLTSKSHNSGTVKDMCKMFAPNWGFSRSGNQMVLFKFLLDPPSLSRQQADVIWTQNRPLLSLYKTYHQDFFGVRQFNYVSEICVRPTPVAMETKIWKFLRKIYHNSAQVPEFCTKLVFWGSAGQT